MIKITLKDAERKLTIFSCERYVYHQVTNVSIMNEKRADRARENDWDHWSHSQQYVTTGSSLQPVDGIFNAAAATAATMTVQRITVLVTRTGRSESDRRISSLLTRPPTLTDH